MVTCLSNKPGTETCYHFVPFFAKLFTANRFLRKERIRKTLPLSTIFALLAKNRHFSPIGEKWRLRWNVTSSRPHKKSRFSRFLRYPATSRGRFMIFAGKSILTTSSGIKNDPATGGQKWPLLRSLWRVFPLKKVFDRRPVSIKKSTPDWDETTSKNDHFLVIF